jgi:hypothetical protein
VADYQAVKDSLIEVEAYLADEQSALAPAIAALRAKLALVVVFLDTLGEVLAGLQGAALGLAPEEPLRDELLDLLGGVASRVDALRGA